ncbi:MAG: Gfo/Idh/MocA family oxidoreductase [Oscillospiraceae bacterium]|nr:Gfo/Idh/MocA family oxidoreductase [Oscillospiraceae bacterium]
MKIGIIGTGSISKSMIPEFQRCDAFHCAAILSRKEETGRAMAEQFGIEKVYTVLEDMLADPDIELVYVASPNSIHYRQTKACLLAGKHVLCEKPFAPTAEEARELIALAKEKHLFLFEAITTAHHPHYALVRQHLDALGALKLVLCTFCQFSSRYPALLAGKPSPVLDHAYAGGALMDINLYNIHFAAGLFGEPEQVQYYPNLYETGVDTSGVLVMQYPGFLCQCVGAKDSAAQNGVQIIGEKGCIHVTPSASNLLEVTVSIRGQESITASLPENPWYYEVQDIGRMIAAGDYDGCYAALETTQTVVSILERARKSAGFSF